MLQQPLRKTICVLILLIIAVAALHANGISSEDGHEVIGKRELTKRGLGTSGVAPNDYGPAIKITSSILQLTKSNEGNTAVGDVGLQRHETTLEHAWPAATGHQLPAAQTVWLEFPANQQDFHLFAVPDLNSNNDHHDFLQPTDGAANAGETGGTSPEVTSQFSKGLHTQVISSSGKDVMHVSDNLDFGAANDKKAKGEYRPSYGR